LLVVRNYDLSSLAEQMEVSNAMSGRDYTVIDGSYGEGGGQIVRTSLSLALITGKALKLTNIRGRRKRPGLRPQHLTSLEACVAVSMAKVEGARIGARELTFAPETILPGSYTFHIGTAGAAALVLQTILPPLFKAGGESNLVVGGGTHVPWSPTFHYFTQVFVAMIGQLGFTCVPQIGRWGWYPRGGGEIRASVEPKGTSDSVLPGQHFELQRVTGISASSQLPKHIRVRQKRQMQFRLREAGVEAEIVLVDVPALNPGSLVFVCAHGRESLAGFSSLGARGKPAERVADEAVGAFLKFLDSKAALDPYLADQILIYLAIIPGKAKFTASSITQHLLTNAWVIEKFLPVRFEIIGGLGEAGTVIKRDR
jgi:RNA 3'-terminal phosphate cyclase (ATP)